VRLLLPDARDLRPEDLYDLYDGSGPYVRAGFVASLDGVVAVDGRSKPLQSPADLAVYRALRVVCDAVVVGAGTLRKEGYGPVRFPSSGAAWREAHGRPPEVPVVVVSRTGDLGDGRVLEGPTIVAGPAPTGVEEIPSEPAAMVAALHERGLTRLLCEGGPSLLTDLLEADLVTEVCLTSAHLLVGAGPRLVGELAAPRDLRLVTLVHDSPGVLIGRWSVVPGQQFG